MDVNKKSKGAFLKHALRFPNWTRIVEQNSRKTRPNLNVQG